MALLSAVLANLLITLLVVAAISFLMFILYRLIERVGRLPVFACLFLALFALAWAKTLTPATDSATTTVAGTLASIGTAALSFIGGNGFSFGAEGGEITALCAASDPVTFCVDAAFQLLSLLALALTAGSVLSFFTSASSWLSTHIDRFEQIVIVSSSADLAAFARTFAQDAARGDARPRAVFSIVRSPSGDKTYRLNVGDTTRDLSPRSFRRRLNDLLNFRAIKRLDDNQISFISYKNGRITVSQYSDIDFDNIMIDNIIDYFINDTSSASPLQPTDVYSYSLEEIKVRQLMRSLLPSSESVDDTGFGLGLKPLNALIVGEDIERIILMAAYLVRNGQALRAVLPDGSVVAARPRIAIASPNAARIERRLRSSYPALFPIAPSAEGEAIPLTAPATLTFFTSKFSMLESVDISADDLLLVINTEPDYGRAPSQREVWQRCLQKRLSSVTPVYIQHDEEGSGIVFEDSSGGRVSGAGNGEKRVLLYGNITESMRAAGLLHKELDRAAMLVNLRYGLGADLPKPSLFDPSSNEKFLPAARKEWLRCDAYGRESSRATADYAPVERFLWSKGTGEVSRANSRKGNDGALRKAIGQLEHLRWLAYMVTSGFTTKPWDELPEAYAQALQDNQALDNPASPGRVFKDLTVDLRAREHAALVDWDYLPALDALFSRMGRETNTYEDLLSEGRLKPNQEKDCDIIDDLIS